ncbi:hypothetical protein KM043_016096 [Ampulex compressa]|nr:hypothetical protein KM043_016096 [Ampulex compressa]
MDTGGKEGNTGLHFKGEVEEGKVGDKSSDKGVGIREECNGREEWGVGSKVLAEDGQKKGKAEKGKGGVRMEGKKKEKNGKGERGKNRGSVEKKERGKGRGI